MSLRCLVACGLQDFQISACPPILPIFVDMYVKEAKNEFPARLEDLASIFCLFLPPYVVLKIALTEAAVKLRESIYPFEYQNGRGRSTTTEKDCKKRLKKELDLVANKKGMGDTDDSSNEVRERDPADVLDFIIQFNRLVADGLEPVALRVVDPEVSKMVDKALSEARLGKDSTSPGSVGSEVPGERDC